MLRCKSAASAGRHGRRRGRSSDKIVKLIDAFVNARSNFTGMLLTLDWNPRALPAATQVENVPLRTADGAATGGALYAKENWRTAVFLMHPREFFAFHYLVPSIVEAGFAAWAQLPRSVGLDLRLEHEIALFDVASGMKFLKDRGFERVVLLGNSGGSGLF